jgi:hypothetical protein
MDHDVCFGMDSTMKARDKLCMNSELLADYITNVFCTADDGPSTIKALADQEEVSLMVNYPSQMRGNLIRHEKLVAVPSVSILSLQRIETIPISLL